MEKLLTVSVAAYNVEQFLEKTLGSLSDGRYVDKLEVFVVDDGGQDRSLEIARNFEEKYPGTFHAVHKENGGYGSTVAYSIEHATGKYFKLLDGDDWMDRNGLNTILLRLENCEEDVIITDYYFGPSENELELASCKQKDDSVVDISTYRTSYPHGMWSIFYRTEILQACHIDFPEHTLYTDQIYSTMPFALAKKIRFFNTPVYCYRYGRQEQSTSRSSRVKHAEEMFRVCDILYDFYEENKENNLYLLDRVSRFYIVALKTLLIFPVNEENRRKIISYEQQMKKKHPDLYAAAPGNNKMGQFIKLMRKTGYEAYWLLRILPNRMLS